MHADGQPTKLFHITDKTKSLKEGNFVVQKYYTFQYAYDFFSHSQTTKCLACCKMAIFDVGLETCFPLCSSSPNSTQNMQATFGVLVCALCSSNKTAMDKKISEFNKPYALTNGTLRC